MPLHLLVPHLARKFWQAQIERLAPRAEAGRP